jgi:periplasmic protein TonB
LIFGSLTAMSASYNEFMRTGAMLNATMLSSRLARAMPLVCGRPDRLEARYPARALQRRLGMAIVASLAVHAAVMSLSLPAPRVSLFEPPAVLQVSLREVAGPRVTSPELASRAPPQEKRQKHEPVPFAGTSELPAPTPRASPPEKRTRPEPRKHEAVPPARTNELPAPMPPANVEEERVRSSAAEGDVASANLPPQPARPPLAAQVPVPREPSSELLSSYGQIVSQALARHKEYPYIAQVRRWEGAVTMRLRVAASGRLLDAKVQTSSGHEVLDAQALEMARRAGRLPAPPNDLHDREEVAVLVAIVFRLER